MHTIQRQDWGLVDYAEAWSRQEELLRQNVDQKMHHRQLSGDHDVSTAPTTSYFIFCEHPPVYTLGKTGDEKHLLLSMPEMKQRGIDFHRTNRGGDITFHGPGQIVGYPILDLEKWHTDIGRYLRSLEEVIIKTLSHFSINAGRSPGETGVWIDADIPHRARKICAMGVRCSRWVTMHGFALNVNVDLQYFNHIIPCGIQGKAVTSMNQELGYELSLPAIREIIASEFQSVFEWSLS
ncbi:MAG: lipoyl(octanoyl) transferase LipB [Ferruginibacter sp.]